jgi:ribonuclease HI
MYYGWKSLLVFQVVETQSSFNAELQAVEMALAVAPLDNIHIFSDNKAVWPGYGHDCQQ